MGCEHKTSDFPTSPSVLRCTKRTANKLSLEWNVADPDGAKVTSCDVQVFGAMFWQDAEFDSDAGPRRLNDCCWGATIIGLVLDTSFDVRVCARNAVGASAWSEQQQFTTNGRAEKPFNVKWFPTEPGQLTLEWQVADFEGAEVLSCGVKVLVEPAIASPYWDTAQFSVSGSPIRVRGDLWRAILLGLQPNSKYTLRVYGTNAAGDGKEIRQEIITLSVPDTPVDFTCRWDSSNILRVQWNVGEPAGAPVTSCDVEVSGSLWWKAWVFAKLDEPHKHQDERWTANLRGVAAGTTLEMRVRSCNAVGSSPWLSHHVVAS